MSRQTMLPPQQQQHLVRSARVQMCMRRQIQLLHRHQQSRMRRQLQYRKMHPTLWPVHRPTRIHCSLSLPTHHFRQVHLLLHLTGAIGMHGADWPDSGCAPSQH